MENKRGLRVHHYQAGILLTSVTLGLGFFGNVVNSHVVKSVLPTLTAKADTSDSSNPIADDTSERTITVHTYVKTDTNGDKAGTGSSSDMDGYSDNDKQPLANVLFYALRVKVADGYSKIDPTNPQSYVLLQGEAGAPQGKTDANGTVSLDLGKGTSADGTYLVLEDTDSISDTKELAPFVVDVPQTLHNASGSDGLRYDVSVFPKNELVNAPGVDKLVNAAGTNDDENSQEANGVDGVKAGDDDDTDQVDTDSAGRPVVWNLLSQIPGSQYGPSQDFIPSSYHLTAGAGNGLESLVAKTGSNSLVNLDDAKSDSDTNTDKEGNSWINGDIADSMAYTLTDKLDSNLTYQGLSFAIGYYDKNSKLQVLPLSKISDGEFDDQMNDNQDSTPTVNITKPDSTNNNQLTVDFTDTGRTDLDTLGADAMQYLSDNDLMTDSTSVFLMTNVKTTLNPDYKAGVIDNNFSLKYVNENDREFDSDTSNTEHNPIPGNTHPKQNQTPQIGVVDAGIDKVSQDNQKALAGASFAIAPTEADAKAGHFIKTDSNGTLYYPGDADYNNADLTTYTKTSGDDGSLWFTGLRGTDVQQSDIANDTISGSDYNRSYYAVETKAPSGYELYKTPIELSATYNSADAKQVADPSSSLLPNTGGQGMTGLIIVAVALATVGGGFKLLDLHARKFE